MKIAAIAAVLLVSSVAAAQAQNRPLYGTFGSGGGNGVYGSGSNTSSHQSSGYTTNSGTTVQPYQATNPNSTQMDNYSTRGNVNPYNGAVGTRNPKF